MREWATTCSAISKIPIRRKTYLALGLLPLTTVLLWGAYGEESSAAAPASPIVAMLLPESVEAKWAKDASIFTAELKKEVPSATVLVFNANNDPNQQQTQFDAALTKGANIIAMVAVDSNGAASMVNKAFSQKVPVLAFDHLINRTPHLAAYISPDGFQQGKVLGEWVAANTKDGDKLAIINGSPTDNNAQLYRNGFLSVLEPLFKSGKRIEAAETWVKGWDPQIAQTAIEEILTKTHNDINAVVIPWDDGAGVVAVALKNQGLTGKVKVTGGDATAAALNRLLLGTQSMTVLRDDREESKRTAEVAARLLKDGTIPRDLLTAEVDNGAGKIPSSLLSATVITPDDVTSLVKDGWVTKEDVCKDVPAGRGPC